VANVWIGGDECLRHLWRISSEKQNGAINRIGERSAEDEFAALHGGSGESEVLRPEWRPPLHVIRHHIVEKQVMHSTHTTSEGLRGNRTFNLQC